MIVHVSGGLLVRYSEASPSLDDATVWSIEVHLERCSPCRRVLALVTDSGTAELLDRVSQELDRQIAASPSPARHRWVAARHRLAAVALLPWLAMIASVLVVALALERLFPGHPSLVLLLAPVAPLLAVAGAWSRQTDAAWEVVSASPRAGLWMLLRRTLAALLLVIPMLAVAGWADGHAPALWLLPCLAFTLATLALGGVVGVRRAAIGLGGAWAAGVIAPSLITDDMSMLLRHGSLPGWALAAAVAAVLMFVRSNDHVRLASRT